MVLDVGEWRYLKDFIVADVNNLAEVEDTPLRKVASPLTFPLTEEDKGDCLDLMWKYDSLMDRGVGVTAPQVGVSKRIIIIGIRREVAERTQSQAFYPTVWINPRYYNLTDEMEEGWEQCDSVKNVLGQVKRYKSIIYSGFHEDGRPIRGRADGYAARIIQHKIDHLDGKLYIDYVPKGKLLTEERYMEIFHTDNLEWVPFETEKTGPPIPLPWSNK